MNAQRDGDTGGRGMDSSLPVSPAVPNSVGYPKSQLPQVPQINLTTALAPTFATIQALRSGITAMASGGTQWHDDEWSSKPSYTRQIAGGTVTVFIDVVDETGDSRALLPRLWDIAHQLSFKSLIVLQALLAQWATLANSANEATTISVDRILQYRGLKAITKSSDAGPWRHGYRAEQRIEIAQELASLSAVHFHISNVSVYTKKAARRHPPAILVHTSRLINVTDVWGEIQTDGETLHTHIRYLPGAWVDEFSRLGVKQFGIIMAQNLSYEPRHEAWELAMASWLTLEVFPNNCGGGRAIRRAVDVILNAIGQKTNNRFPQRTRRRFERMLDRMVRDGYLEGWCYATSVDGLPTKGWSPSWLATKIELKPSRLFEDYYDRRNPSRGRRLHQRGAKPQ